MTDTFSEVKLFQVKPDKIDEFEELIKIIAKEQNKQQGSLHINYMKRFYTMDGLIKEGLAPRKLTKVVKCVKYYSYWEFDDKENYGKATRWFFDEYAKIVTKLLIMPFDMNCGDTIY
ncbi:hypothetical protein DesfrDRAFT_0802 [Solidesulfovibrio fructosivorans JJ]]|uniref:Uncharacterized protein n=1 Tax=Solidesulfovibrio fructosivorans JJ] TaxID=596151 RepID=E1JT53_SOLFR|nr:hypothetical protein [Solidesulfovibrio fructosivorans]EFL52313.1 hypothetical protein DesfrDRAFT_0802 [Solidesulfovibrio fructosivorans JJ]]